MRLTNIGPRDFRAFSGGFEIKPTLYMVFHKILLMVKVFYGFTKIIFDILIRAGLKCLEARGGSGRNEQVRYCRFLQRRFALAEYGIVGASSGDGRQFALA